MYQVCRRPAIHAACQKCAQHRHFCIILRTGVRRIGSSRVVPSITARSAVRMLPLYSIHRGTVSAVKHSYAFVRIANVRGDGFLHKSQMTPARRVCKGDEVWVKVITIDNRTSKYSLSMKYVDQGSGRDVDPQQVELTRDLALSIEKRNNNGGDSAAAAAAAANSVSVDVTCTRCGGCGGYGHQERECFGARAKVTPSLETPGRHEEQKQHELRRVYVTGRTVGSVSDNGTVAQPKILRMFSAVLLGKTKLNGTKFVEYGQRGDVEDAGNLVPRIDAASMLESCNGVAHGINERNKRFMDYDYGGFKALARYGFLSQVKLKPKKVFTSRFALRRLCLGGMVGAYKPVKAGGAIFLLKLEPRARYSKRYKQYGINVGAVSVGDAVERKLCVAKAAKENVDGFYCLVKHSFCGANADQQYELYLTAETDALHKDTDEPIEVVTARNGNFPRGGRKMKSKMVQAFLGGSTRVAAYSVNYAQGATSATYSVMDSFSCVGAHTPREVRRLPSALHLIDTLLNLGEYATLDCASGKHLSLWKPKKGKMTCDLKEMALFGCRAVDDILSSYQTPEINSVSDVVEEKQSQKGSTSVKSHSAAVNEGLVDLWNEMNL